MGANNVVPVRFTMSTRIFRTIDCHLIHRGFLCWWILLLTVLKTSDGLQPNIVFILTDDQDIQLGGVIPMTKTKQFFDDHGVTFTNAFTTVPLCCPSRASILTGQYQHRHGVVNNSLAGNCYGHRWKNAEELDTFVAHLKRANYTTFFAGKYLNQYGIPAKTEAKRVPYGWDHWDGLVGNSVYYNYTLSVNGQIEHHGSNTTDYLTDLINDRAVHFLQNLVLSDSQPFFMMLSTPSCHAPFTPSDQYMDAFLNTTAPRTPNYNMSGGPDKHWLLRQAPSHLTKDVLRTVDSIYQQRWATLLSVDDLVQNVVHLLTVRGLLNNTFLVFSSDNGFHFGQFSLPWDKRQMYDFDVRVPLMIAGPRVTPGLVREEPIVNIDLAPTFLDLAGLPVPQVMDGMSLVSLLNRSEENRTTTWRESFLIEYQGEGSKGPVEGCPQYATGGVSNCFPDCICEDAWNNTYTCVRTITATKNLIYCKFYDHEAFVEMYNINTDPYQMNNLATNLSQTEHHEFNRMIRSLKFMDSHPMTCTFKETNAV